MNQRAKKYIIVLFTVLFSAVFFTVTAFAQAGITPENDSSTPVSSAVNKSSSVSSSQESSSSPSSSGESQVTSNADGTGNVDVPPQEETVMVKLDYNDGSAVRVVNVKPGTQVKNLAVPTRKGYLFDYWTMNGAKVSSSFEIYSEISLTAKWEASAESSRKPSSYASVDTHQREVEQAASRAEEAVSDPGVLSSEDWNSILSTGSQAASAAGTASSQASSAASQGGGGSWLFPVGIALIVLSACGIGAFLYLQFFSGPGPRGPKSGAGTEEFDDLEFTDISSNSTGPYAAPEEPESEPRARSAGSDSDDTRPIPPQARPEAARRKDYDASRSQARAVDGEKKNFDWDKFFNDDI
ncbi:InlB B-repeat-containing protein [Caproicibacter fermentans]|uniref:InlB B-repeat-containing protein n=1 Tax=Caproicibacter fermentans TaxID=2576756 RepID=A0A7G8T7Q6_9FIRM|nr:InlB B-repeat-containing protein [Caproicibacter fermentans]QNK39647.1 InlB B-repeat-containing protein [Caproicibacter fermentans]